MVEAIILPLVKIVIVLVAVLVTVMYIVLLERKVQAWVQVRLGPMRVGPHGILQPLADVLKLFVKEDITPVMSDQEFRESVLGSPIYWEGLCTVTGTRHGGAVSGHAYVELTNYTP